MARTREWTRVGTTRRGKPAAPAVDPYGAARTAAMTAEAELKRLAVQERQGRLVDRELGERVVFTFGRRHRDAWLVWPARIGAELAAALGVDAGVLISHLEEYVAHQLDELAAERFDLGAPLVDDASGKSAS